MAHEVINAHFSLYLIRRIPKITRKLTYNLNSAILRSEFIDKRFRLEGVHNLVISKLDGYHTLYRQLPNSDLKSLRFFLNGVALWVFLIFTEEL